MQVMPAGMPARRGPFLQAAFFAADAQRSLTAFLLSPYRLDLVSSLSRSKVQKHLGCCFSIFVLLFHQLLCFVPVKEYLANRCMMAIDSHMERVVSRLVFGFQICLGLEQKLQSLESTGACRSQKRKATASVLGVHLGTCLNKNPDHLIVPLRGRIMQGAATRRRCRIAICTGFGQQRGQGRRATAGSRV